MTTRISSSQPDKTPEAPYKVLKAVPDLDKVMNDIKRGMLPVVGTKHSADADPTSRSEVRGVKVDVAKLAAYTQATGLRLSNELPPTYFFVVAFPLTMDLMAREDFPFAATGARIVANVAKLLEERGSGRGLISVCAAAGQGTVMLLESVTD